MKDILKEARERMGMAIDATSANRVEMQDDVRFSHGDQWPQSVAMQRKLDSRPIMTINKTDAFVRQVVNNMRQQRPRIVVHPVSDGADEHTANIIQGLMRHIEVNSNADYAYDTAAEFQVRMGLGYIRLCTKYVADDSFDQEIYIEAIKNPFTVYMDPMSIAPDGSDSKWCFITERMRKSAFKRAYPKAKAVGFGQYGVGDDMAAWGNKEEIVVAEYLRIEEEDDELLRLTTKQDIFRSDYLLHKQAYDSSGIYPAKTEDGKIFSRPTTRHTVCWSKITATEELEKRKLPGKMLPIFPVYGAEAVMSTGRRSLYGMVRDLKDPQRMLNFWRAQLTELLSMAPKSPWIVAEGQTENYETEWAQAHIKNYSHLTYKPVLVTTSQGQDIPLPPPTRLPSPEVPQGSIQAGLMASDDLKSIAGQYDAALGAQGNETSGKMVAERQAQSDQSNFHFYDNLTRSIQCMAKVILDWIPVYYDTERVIRIIGDDQKPKSITINESVSGSLDKVLNDMSVGRYDVVMETGPGYQTKREQSFAMMTDLSRAFPEVMQNAADLIIRQSDAPGAQDIADRIEAMTPAAQLNKDMPEDIDPKAKPIIMQLQAQLQQAKKTLEQLQMEKQAHVFGVQAKEEAATSRAQMQQEHETHRLTLRELGEDERTKMKIDAALLETRMKDQTSMQETIIDAQTNLAIAHKQALQHGAPNANNASNA